MHALRTIPRTGAVGPLVAGLLTLVLAGCSAHPGAAGPGGAGGPDVATLQRSGAAAAASPATTARRPLIRPDATTEEVIALQNAYAGCLAEHGVPVTPADGANPERKETVDVSLPQYASARAACADKQPEDWRSVEARTDPQYADRQRAELKCLTDQGIKAELRGDPPGIVFTDDRQLSRAMELAGQCERKAFGDAMQQFDGK